MLQIPMTGRSRRASSENPFGLSQARWLKALMSSPANQWELRSFRGFPSSSLVAMCLNPVANRTDVRLRPYTTGAASESTGVGLESAGGGASMASAAPAARDSSTATAFSKEKPSLMLGRLTDNKTVTAG